MKIDSAMDLFRVERYMGEDEDKLDQPDENLRLKQLQCNIEDRKRKRHFDQNEDTHVTSDSKRFAEDVEREENGTTSKEKTPIKKRNGKKQKQKSKEATFTEFQVDEAKDDELDLDTDSLRKYVDVKKVTEKEGNIKMEKRSQENLRERFSEKGSTAVDNEQGSTEVSADLDSEMSRINEPKHSKKKIRQKGDKREMGVKSCSSTDAVIKEEFYDGNRESSLDSEIDKVAKKKKKNREIVADDGGMNKKNQESQNQESQNQESQNQESQNSSEKIAQEENNETGFTVMGRQKKEKQVKKVQRVLPDWLANPVVINSDFGSSLLPIDQIPYLDQHIINKLQQHDINHLFPVQNVVIPAIFSQIDTRSCSGRGGFQPSDICVSAPTGSGKTLAYVLPVVQTLLNRVVCHLRALIIMPTKDLANQVKQVFDMFTEGTNLKVGLASGLKSFAKDQGQLVGFNSCGSSSRVDILVCTPGRLVDHIISTPCFTLHHVRFLVIDEADRLLGQSYLGWLRKVLKAAYNTQPTTMDLSKRPMCCNLQTVRNPPGQQTASSFSAIQLPLQKLLFSATMTHSPEKLALLQLYQPILFTVMGTVNQTDGVCWPPGGAGNSVVRYSIPEGLSEYMTICSNGEKPLMVLYFLRQLKFQGVLCFASSLEATHRLYLLVKLYGGVEAAEYSSSLTAQQRKRIIRDFKQNKLQLLVCSDAMARGMDIQNVSYVISYDVPNFVRTYIHRVGRTARAGNQGTAITLLHSDEVYHFKDVIRKTGRQKIPKYNIKEDKLKSMVQKYQEALAQLQDAVKLENQKKTTQIGKQQVVTFLQEQFMKNLLQKNPEENS